MGVWGFFMIRVTKKKGEAALDYLSKDRTLDQIIEEINKIKEPSRIKRRIWDKNRRKDPIVALKENLSISLRTALKKAGNTKKQKTLKYLGCSILEFRTYISGFFEDWMTWDNYGNDSWHLDHVRPCASFDLSNDEEVKKCFHYTNYRPLKAKDNIKKGSYWEGRKHYYKKNR